MRHSLVFCFLLFLHLPALTQEEPDLAPLFPLQSAPSAAEFTEQLHSGYLFLRPDDLATIRSKEGADPIITTYLKALRDRADRLLTEPPLERRLTGRRLLGVSREALRRITTLALLHRLDNKPAYRDRAISELRAVSRFSDWNPSHFLDVAEMSLAVALGLSWLEEELSAEDRTLIREALLTKGLRASYATEHWWIRGGNNWNQVCHAGMLAAALALADEQPELARQTLVRALDGMPYALRTYAPDGVYPEGPGYWAYGTGFSIVTVELLRSAFGHDFGMANSPGFLASAAFRVFSQAPSGRPYNFGDNGLGAQDADLLTWFATETNNAELFLTDELLTINGREKGSRISALVLPLIARYSANDQKANPLPDNWAGGGINPVGFLRSPRDSTFYLGAKGGSAAVNHGNMDAGSFVFELDGVRWSVDLGSQSYHELEKTGFKLWGRGQQSQRWTLISKNNYWHSTLTVNDAHHRADGYAPLTARLDDAEPSLITDLTEVLQPGLESFIRTWTRTKDDKLLITDELVASDSLQSLNWHLVTYADVELVDGGAILRQDGKRLRVEILAPANLAFSVTQGYPPPLELDMQLPGLKRLDLHLPGWMLREREAKIEVLLRRE